MRQPSKVGAVGNLGVEDDAGLVGIVAEVEENHCFEVVGGVQVPGGHPVEHEFGRHLGLRWVDVDIASSEIVESLRAEPRRPGRAYAVPFVGYICRTVAQSG